MCIRDRGEDVDAQLFFQLNDGLRDAGLRGEQRLGRLGQVEVLPNGFAYKTKLVKIHSLFYKFMPWTPAYAGVT